MYLPMQRRGYESRFVTTFNYRYSTQKQIEPSFLEGNTIGPAHLVAAGSITFSAGIRTIYASVTCLSVGRTWCGVK